ncbi:NTP transferase domain-containing protein, partial [Deltaproteobacteria bacterium OttesenSCG-928-M10]|nr:NTP transferase domain-containing protein [Deltaproteobacteria bacterium OttesenSCG-928-M10]
MNDSTIAPAVLILAAGRGTRMKSEKPKVLHPLMGRPLIEHVINAALYLQPAKVVVVTGFGADEVEADVSAFMADLSEKRGPAAVPSPVFVRQTEQLGTGHAVSMAREALAGFPGPVMIMSGDVPLIAPDTLDGFLKAHQALEAGISVLTVRLEDPAAYGRIIRDEANWLERIVEYRDATDEQRLINEINSGLYVAGAAGLFAAIDRLTPNNDQKEYYLTDVIADFRRQGLTAAAVEIPDCLAYEVGGINDRYELAA